MMHAFVFLSFPISCKYFFLHWNHFLSNKSLSQFQKESNHCYSAGKCIFVGRYIYWMITNLDAFPNHTVMYVWYLDCYSSSTPFLFWHGMNLLLTWYQNQAQHISPFLVADYLKLLFLYSGSIPDSDWSEVVFGKGKPDC